MGTKTKIAITLMVLQIIAIAGIILSNNGGNFLGALGESIGLCAFTVISIGLIYLDNKQKKDSKSEYKIDFAESIDEEADKLNEATKNIPTDYYDPIELTDNELKIQERNIFLIKVAGIIVALAIMITSILISVL